MRMLSLDHLYKELCGQHFRQGTKPRIYGDNECMVTSLSNRIHRGTEVPHIATTFHLTADLVHEGNVDLVQVPTVDILAYGFTQPFARPGHRAFCARLGLVWRLLPCGAVCKEVLWSVVIFGKA
jgi:hypothetical protein